MYVCVLWDTRLTTLQWNLLLHIHMYSWKFLPVNGYVSSVLMIQLFFEHLSGKCLVIATDMSVYSCWHRVQSTQNSRGQFLKDLFASFRKYSRHLFAAIVWFVFWNGLVFCWQTKKTQPVPKWRAFHKIHFVTVKAFQLFFSKTWVLCTAVHLCLTNRIRTKRLSCATTG
jgi:hypothetical protein